MRRRSQPVRDIYGLIPVGPLTPYEMRRDFETRLSNMGQRLDQADKETRREREQVHFWKRCWSEMIDHLAEFHKARIQA